MARRLTGSEILLALVVASICAAIPVGRVLFDGSRVLFAVDTASASAPGNRGPAENALLSEQGVALYPACRYAVESLCAGRLPRWNPDVHAGVPWLANPERQVFDPETLFLVLCEKLGGRALFDRGLAWLAWLRLAAAGLGAYVLARRLGLAPPSASLSAVGFAGSGALVLGLGSSAGHVIPVLPWLLVAVDRLRDTSSLRGSALVAGATALAILGGRPESAFFCGLTALVWAALALQGRARTLAMLGLALGVAASAPLLLPFVELLRHSSALAAQATSDPATHGFDALSLLLLALFGALVAAWRGLDTESWSDSKSLLASLGVVLASCLCISILSGRGLGDGARALVLFDALLAPGSGAWRGRGAFSQSAAAWLSTAVLVLAFASLFARAGALRSRGLVHALGLAALLLALATPGVADAWRSLPLFGRGAAACAACTSALCLSLAAGEALQSASRQARRTAALTLVAFVCLALAPHAAQSPGRAPDPPDEFVQCAERPPEVLSEGRASFAGTLAAAVPCDALALRVERVNAEMTAPAGEALIVPIDLPAVGADLRRHFRTDRVEVVELAPGIHRFALDILRRNERGRLERSGSRVLAWSTITVKPLLGAWSAAFAVLGFLAALFVAGSRSRGAWAVVALSLAHSLVFARGLLTSEPRAPGLHLSETEKLLAAESGGQRVFAGPGVLPGNTALLAGLSSAGGDESLKIARFDAFRSLAMKHGADPVRDWNALGVDLASPAFKLLGVKLVALKERADLADFDLVAGPDTDCARKAETFVYAARDPLPRAFCVPRIVERNAAISGAKRFDPAHEAFLEPEDAWRPVTPFTRASVETLVLEPEHQRLAVDVDGDALLVLTDQAFPGWVARIDGVEERLHTTDANFRGIALTPGAHTIDVTYEPASLNLGAWIGLLAFATLWILALIPPRQAH